MFNKGRHFVGRHKLQILTLLVSFIIFCIIYAIRLGGFIRGDSAYESIRFLHINGAADIFDNIAFGPIKFFEIIAVRIDQPNATLLRLGSLCVVAISLILFYFVIRKWHSSRIAMLSTLVMGCSSYYLHSGRFTTQDAVYLAAFPALILFGTWLKSRRYVNRLVFVLPATAALLYLPGFIVILGSIGIMFNKRLKLAWDNVSTKRKIVGIASSVLVTLPLFIGLIRNASQIKDIVGVDRLLEMNINDMADSVFALGSQLFINGPSEPFRWLVGTPIIDVGTAALLLLGIYSYARNSHTLRARLLFAFICLSSLLFITGSLVSISLLLPLLYFGVAAGIAYLLQSWYLVFPKNPAARLCALAIMCVLCVSIALYHIQRFFIAWPHTPETRSSLNEPIDKVLQ